MAEPTIIPKCPRPAEPGRHLVRHRKGGTLSMVEIKLTKGELWCYDSWRTKLLSEVPEEARWWGPVEVKK